MNGMTLRTELEHYADQAVAAYRFRNRAEVVGSRLRLLQQSDAEVAPSLEEARARATVKAGLSPKTSMSNWPH